MLGGDDRAVVGVVIGRDTNAKVGDFRDQTLAQFIGCTLTHRHHHRQSHAAFTGRAKGGPGQVLDHLIHVGVRQDDAVVLCTAHGLDPLMVLGPLLIDIVSDVA